MEISHGKPSRREIRSEKLTWLGQTGATRPAHSLQNSREPCDLGRHTDEISAKSVYRLGNPPGGSASGGLNNSL